MLSNDKKYCFIIPCLNPDESLMKVLEELREKSNERIFIVDDGSSEESKVYFRKVQNNYKNVFILEHKKNLGKGAALKTAFSSIIQSYPQVQGVVVLDSDGQHDVRDCLQVLQELKKSPNSLILGYRNFDKSTPWKSYLGNKMSQFFYSLVLGKKIRDTQTGLRAFRIDFMKKSLEISSNGFAFETDQLALAVKEEVDIVEIPIRTIYIDDNKASSFRPVIDSFKIYFTLLKYILTSISTLVIDLFIFSLSIFFGGGIFLSNMLARTGSVFFQFFVLKKVVFKSSAGKKEFFYFAMYVYMMGMISSYLQIVFLAYISSSILWAKILVELLVFIINFFFLRKFMFKK